VKSTASRSRPCSFSPRSACWRNPAGLAIDALAPVATQILGSRMPAQAGQPWLSIVPIAEGRSSYNGLLVMVFITLAASLAVYFIHRFASRALRRGPAWGCGFSDAVPAAQYSSVSFAQPIRRVFGTLLFHARDHVDMPPPGDSPAGPAADRTARPGLARTLRADSRMPSALRPRGSTACNS
jgi:hypothetical protein